MMHTIDAASFQRMVIHASASLNALKQPINDLNVFPVPDGDTGTNMGLTMAAAATELKKQSCTTVGQAAQKAASALLRGARGNSGVILSLLFRGFSKAIKERETMDGRDLAIALDFGVAAAYKAVMKPAEGTILTVSRLAAQRAAAAAREENCAEYVLQAAIEEGQIALDNTINQNPVLKKAGVVDAGGKGFLVILQGMLDEFVKKIYGEGTRTRLRPSYFPFTEPSVEVDCSCFECGGKGCKLCKGTGWIEILGAGVVNNKVLENCGIDSSVYSGFAFGIGIERTAMLKYGINNIKLLFESDLRVLKQLND